MQFMRDLRGNRKARKYSTVFKSALSIEMGCQNVPECSLSRMRGRQIMTFCFALTCKSIK